MKKVQAGGTSRSTAKARSRSRASERPDGGRGWSRWRSGRSRRSSRSIRCWIRWRRISRPAKTRRAISRCGRRSWRPTPSPVPIRSTCPTALFKITIAGTGEDAAAKGDLDIRGDLTITGRGHTGTIIDGNSLDRVFHVLSGNVSLSQLTIQGGRSNVGGGLLNSGGHVTLSSVFVQNNQAIGADGAAGADSVPGVSPATNGQSGGEADGGGIAQRERLADPDRQHRGQQRGVRRQWRPGRRRRGPIGANGVPSTDLATRNGHDAGGGPGGIGGRGGLAQGGGVFNAAGASLTLSHSVVSDNTASGGLGGAGGRGGNAVGGRGADRAQLRAGDRGLRGQRHSAAPAVRAARPAMPAAAACSMAARSPSPAARTTSSTTRSSAAAAATAASAAAASAAGVATVRNRARGLIRRRPGRLRLRGPGRGRCRGRRRARRRGLQRVGRGPDELRPGGLLRELCDRRQGRKRGRRRRRP